MERSIEGLEFKLTIPGYQAAGGLPVEFYEDDESKPNWARIILPDELLEKITSKTVGDCTLELGSEEDFEVLLEGTGAISEKQEEVLIIQDGLAMLRKTRICNTFLNCSPQEAVRYILTVAGVQKYYLTDSAMSRKNVFTIDDMDALEALKEINTIYGISIPLRYADGAFWWGVEAEQEAVVLITDSNTMKLQRIGEIWEAEILTIPWIKTGNLISVDCEEYTGLGLVTKRIMKSTGKRIDMYINFEEVSEDG